MIKKQVHAMMISIHLICGIVLDMMKEDIVTLMEIPTDILPMQPMLIHPATIPIVAGAEIAADAIRYFCKETKSGGNALFYYLITGVEHG